jgi:hypothetical protein
MEARQGAIRVFSGNTFPAAAPRSPPFRLRPMRDPANRPSRAPLRERPRARTSAGTPPAFSPAQASQDRASGVRGGGLRCACGRTSAPTGDEDGGIGISPQNADGPLPRFPPSAVPDASTHAWSNPRPPPCPDTIPLHCGVISPLQSVTNICHQIRDEPFFQRHLSRLSAPRPTIPASPDARSREPSSRARPRERTRPFAGPGFARSRIRFRGARLRCAGGRPSAPEWGRGWRDRYLPQKRGWPPAALPSLCRCRSVHARVEQPPPAAVP